MNYILKHHGEIAPDLKKVDQAITAHRGKVVDDSMMPDMALVNVDDSEIDKLKHELQEWHIYPEVSYPVPTTRKSVKKQG